MLRDASLYLLAIGKRVDRSGDWIRFPYYHHVFEDERMGFERQLKDFKNHGDFISIGDAASLIEADEPFKGRHFCISFDDGLKSCATGALPIMAELQVPGVFYLATKFIGRNLLPDDPMARAIFNFRGKTTSLDFMSWEDCRHLIDSGMTIGSHTDAHIRLAEHDEPEVRVELISSKEKIEQQTGVECVHFCAPYGVPGTDFKVERDPGLAGEAGYRTFATGQRGATRPGSGAMLLKRDHMLAHAGNHQHRYFLSRG
jgi:peptidoglycan/xylan/chitin deacetylase (PgdA/CDA1 family)